MQILKQMPKLALRLMLKLALNMLKQTRILVMKQVLRLIIRLEKPSALVPCHINLSKFGEFGLIVKEVRRGKIFRT